jgi:hypothetical protein
MAAEKPSLSGLSLHHSNSLLHDDKTITVEARKKTREIIILLVFIY